jgi:hypothetical protein
LLQSVRSFKKWRCSQFAHFHQHPQTGHQRTRKEISHNSNVDQRFCEEIVSKLYQPFSSWKVDIQPFNWMVWTINWITSHLVLTWWIRTKWRFHTCRQFDALL